MRRLSVLLVGTLWLFGLLATDVYVTLRKPNVKHHIDAILAGSVGKVISYKSLRGDRLGPYTLEKVQIAHGLDPDIVVAEIEEITFWINWTGVLFGQRPVSRVLLKHPLLRMRWNTKRELDVTPLASEPSS